MNDIAIAPPNGASTNPSSYRPSATDPILKRARRILTSKASYADRLVSLEDAIKLIECLRQMDCKIAFTTGVWDMTHKGHCRYIEKGKAEVAKLYPEAEHVIMVVGIDSDEVVKKRKGPSRPFDDMEDRCEMLGYMRPADILVPQTEEGQLYRLLPYDARVISTSTTDLPDLTEIQKYCEHLVNLPPQADTSTTARIRRLMSEGKLEMLEKIDKHLSPLLALLDGIRGGK